MQQEESRAKIERSGGDVRGKLKAVPWELQVWIDGEDESELRVQMWAHQVLGGGHLEIRAYGPSAEFAAAKLRRVARDARLVEPAVEDLHRLGSEAEYEAAKEPPTCETCGRPLAEED